MTLIRAETDEQEWARVALERFGGGYLIVAPVRADGAVVDWELVDANEFIWTRWTGGVPSIGARLGGRVPEPYRQQLADQLAVALDGGKPEERYVEACFPGGRAWRRAIAVKIADDRVALFSLDGGEFVEAQARVSALGEHSSDVVAITSVESGLLWVSPSIERTLGYAPADLVGGCAADLIHPDDLPAMIAQFGAVVECPGGAASVELRARSRDGEYRWFECTVTNRLNDDALRGIVLSLHDIDGPRRSALALQASETRLRSILETAGDAIITIEEDGTIASFNRAAERIFGVAANDVIGRSCYALLPRSTPAATMSEARGAISDDDPVVLTIARANGEEFTARVTLSQATLDDRVVYTAIVRDISKQKAAEQELEKLALYDALTGLPNRRLLVDRLDAAIARGRRHGSAIAVMFLDLDRFKLVNDSLGHDVGDRLLVLVAQRLSDTVREIDTVARLGGDEFVILCEELPDRAAVTELALRIEDALSSPFVIAADEVFATGSIGIALWEDGPESAHDLLRFADTAMYRAKEHGRARFELFDERMQALVTARLDLESALQHALNRDELRTHYQPVVDLESGRATHFEALARWDRAGTGMIGPSDFIGIAEETGLIVPIGEWILRRAVLDCASWQTTEPGVGVSVNVSARQLNGSGLHMTAQLALADSGLAPELLTLEITESVLLDDTESILKVLGELRALGVRIALDDFGTGYSSLTYLHRLPIDELKIDQSFVETLATAEPDNRLLETIIHLGAAFDLRVVAEGIDSEQKLATLRELGCRFGQGYLFARPAALADLLAPGVFTR